MGYRRHWEFDEPFRPRDERSFQDYIDFANWKDDMLKKKEEEDKKKASQHKKTHAAKEWSKKEIAIVMFLASPIIAIPVAMGYMAALKSLLHMVQTFTP